MRAELVNGSATEWFVQITAAMTMLPVPLAMIMAASEKFRPQWARYKEA